MEILGVGVPELMFIVLIALILLGPKDMIAAGRTIGKFIRQILLSPTWQVMRRTSEELQQLPTRLVREAGLEDIQKEVQDVANSMKPLDIKKAFEDVQQFEKNKALVLPTNEPTRSMPFSAPVTQSVTKSPDRADAPDSSTLAQNDE